MLQLNLSGVNHREDSVAVCNTKHHNVQQQPQQQQKKVSQIAPHSILLDLVLLLQHNRNSISVYCVFSENPRFLDDQPAQLEDWLFLWKRSVNTFN